MYAYSELSTRIRHTFPCNCQPRDLTIIFFCTRMTNQTKDNNIKSCFGSCVQFKSDHDQTFRTTLFLTRPVCNSLSVELFVS